MILENLLERIRPSTVHSMSNVDFLKLENTQWVMLLENVEFLKLSGTFR